MAKVINGKSYSWTQPLCPTCWFDMHPGRQPLALKEPDPEMCCQCGQAADAGIYIRVDPAQCRFPTPEEE